VSTLAARGIDGFSGMLRHYKEKAALGRNVTIEEIGDTAVFLLSDMSSAITGEVIYVDCGFHMIGF
jgi:enoyl-[acyl-carrier protein] reductase I